jgi:hypothetical protein
MKLLLLLLLFSFKAFTQIKISELPEENTPATDALAPIVQEGETRKAELGKFPISDATQAALDLKAEDYSYQNIIYVDKNGDNDECSIGSILKPCLTIQKAAELIGSASDNDEINDASKRFYQVKVAPGVYTENVTFGTRPFINLNLNAGALIVGSITVQLDQGAINGAGIQSPSFNLSGPNARSLAGGAATIGINGDLIYESVGSGSSLVAIMHVRGIGITGKITKKKTAPAGGYTLGLFIEGAIVQGVIEETTGDSGITLYADNCNDSSSNALGSVSGNVNLNVLNDVRFNGAVVTSSGSHGRWFNVEFKNGQAHDFTGFTGAASSDSNSYESFQANVPTKGSGTFTLLDSARGIRNVPAGNIAATNVQAAINELDTEKEPALGFTPEDSSNKATDFTVSNDTLYPSVKAVKDYVDLKSLTSGDIGDRPSCESSLRGKLYNVQGGSGVADALSICSKNSNDDYVWISYFIVGEQ